MNDELLRLAVGSHRAGSGKGCAMNVVSWENGDKEITDFPPCADELLARVVQRINDSYCTHTQDKLLCPDCSVKVLALAHRTVGTALDLPDDQRARVYVEIAVEEAESVLHLTTDEAPRRACALVRRFLAGEAVTRQELGTAASYASSISISASAAASAASAAAAAYAAYAARASAARASASAAAAYAAYAARASAAYAYVGGDRLDRAHHIIDRFEQITGVRSRNTNPDVTAEAVQKMKEIVNV